MALLFSAVMASRRAYQVETEDGALEGLLLTPIDKATVFLGKTAAVALSYCVLTIAILFLVVLLFDLALADLGPVVLAFALGVIGLATVEASSASWPSALGRAGASSRCSSCPS